MTNRLGPSRFPKNFRSLAFLVCALIISACSYASSEEEIAGYVFLGADLRAKQGDKFFPIAAVDKRSILIEKGNRIRKVENTAVCSLTYNIILSENYAEILSFDYQLTSMSAGQAEADAFAQMFRTEALADATVSKKEWEFQQVNDTSHDNLPDPEAEAADLKQDSIDYNDYVEELVETGRLGGSMKNDTIYVDFEILPQTDLPSAYCAVVVSYDHPEEEKNGVPVREAFVRTRYIGDLKKGEVERIRFSRKLYQFQETNVQCDLLLYSNEFGQVATNLSKALKPVTTAQAAKWLSLSSLSE